MNNIFKLSNPNLWHCEVTHLAKGHGLLTIELRNKDVKDGAKLLKFGHVSYFSGWVTWSGADFRVGTESEFVNFIKLVTSKFDQMSNEELLNTSPFDTTRLFICNTINDDSIHIIANWGMAVDGKGEPLIVV